LTFFSSTLQFFLLLQIYSTLFLLANSIDTSFDCLKKMTFFSASIFCLKISHFQSITAKPEPFMSSDEAWAALVSADQEQDLDDFKLFLLEFARNSKDLMFVDLEKKFREEGLRVYLIAIVTSLPPFNSPPSLSPSPFLPIALCPFPPLILILCLDLIWLQKDIPQQKTIRNLQGDTGKEFLVSFQLRAKYRRTRYFKLLPPFFSHR
jgi:hypothetical protein